jgi:hypothetical protein
VLYSTVTDTAMRVVLKESTTDVNLMTNRQKKRAMQDGASTDHDGDSKDPFNGKYFSHSFFLSLV